MNKPTCIGFIMDGNRRYAREHNLPTLEGHKKGLEEVFLNVVRYVRDAQIPHAVFYAFSTENWNRAREEVDYLMELFSSVLDRMSEEIDEKKVRIRFIGRLTDFSVEIQQKMHEVEERSAQYIDTTIWLALSYGGRAEILDAVNNAVEKGGKVTEEMFSNMLWTSKMPGPAIIVRTGGEKRLSNFLPWQSVYSELHFIEKHWPALTEEDFKDILVTYDKRTRRHGQ